MKLEVGMYCYNITNRKLGIGKIINFQSNNNVNIKYKNEIYLVSIGNIKASFDVIDLIEKNDLIEIEFYSPRYETRVIRLFEVTYTDDKYIQLDNKKCDFLLINKQFTNSDKELKPIFKSIATHQQFKQMSYKLGE